MSIIDHPLLLRSNLARKAVAYGLQVPRAVQRQRSTPASYASSPPIIVNSIPKSGTHMLMQVARAMPGTRYYGSFVARIPSWSKTPRSPLEISRLIKKAVPGEVVGAHLPYDGLTAEAIRSLNALHVFIYRDPRDVVMSEAHYLANMNRWHSMHRTFSKIDSEDERVRVCIEGTGERHFPNVSARLIDYAKWRDDAGTLSVKYEDLYGPGRTEQIERIIDRYEALAGRKIAEADRIEMIHSIDPSRSHTFRSGGTEKWRSQMSGENQVAFNAVGQPLLAALGYQ